MKPTVKMVDLWGLEVDCILCGTTNSDSLFLPMYEGQVVPNDYEGEWAGMPVCRTCYRKHEETNEIDQDNTSSED